ncbi:MAG: hypothetical protein VKJ66_01600 [Synechococcus sp.]|nr:hypothetical protein [Synechococcus sp.]
MLTTSTRLRIQEILGRLAEGQPVSLEERIFVQKFANRDASVWHWQRQAQRRQRQGAAITGVDRLLDDLNLGEAEPPHRHKPEQDDLGDWFSGAPPWLRRS